MHSLKLLDLIALSFVFPSCTVYKDKREAGCCSNSADEMYEDRCTLHSVNV